ncbi:TetR/AcrR family transcriptional regulator [Gordonia terrae]|uniref:TetR/AcrR family transcriptional regulator n=1 Tax=Gordonia terrae TaxID=2055 RepID=UPI002009FB74|nr:TetR/AcrR family transcriptional regulator [Gordonia terrae]UPW08588.1 TetR/AcrR family transcriptional regulator [Gordonia terrae]
MISPFSRDDVDTLVISGGRQLRRAARPARQASYDDEVRQLIKATERVMMEKGRTGQPKVTEVVEAAGMTNQAFYRHFRGRDDLIIATYEQGMVAVYRYLEQRVYQHADLVGRLRAWIHGLLRQIEDPALADLSAIIFWNVAQVPRENTEVEPVGRERIMELLVTILRAGAVPSPERAGQFVHTLVMGTVSQYLESKTVPTDADRQALVDFCLAGIGADR